MTRISSNRRYPEVKTGHLDVEFGAEETMIQKSKEKYENTGGQHVKSKFHPEPQQSR